MSIRTPHLKLRLSAVRSLFWLAIIVLCAVAIIRPSYQHLETNLALIGEAKKTRDSEYQQTTIIGQTRSLLTAVRQQETAIKKLFLTGGDELSLITQIEKMAAALGLKQTILLSDTRAGASATVEERPLEITLTGPLPQLFHFLSQLEFIEPLVLIQTIRIAPATDQAAAINFIISAVVFIHL